MRHDRCRDGIVNGDSEKLCGCGGQWEGVIGEGVLFSIIVFKCFTISFSSSVSLSIFEQNYTCYFDAVYIL